MNVTATVLGDDVAARVELVLHLVELHADELAVLDDEALRRVVLDDLDVLFLGVLEFPRRGLEELPRLRAITFTSVAPTRSAMRQQSIAVLPTPMISTRSPIFSTCPKCTDSSQSMPMWMFAVPPRGPGASSSLPFGAPLPTNTAS